MRDKDSAIAERTIAVTTASSPDTATAGGTRAHAAPAGRRTGTGWGSLLAALGVLAFSLTFPGTTWALEGLGPWSVTGCRLALAGLLALGCLLAVRVPVPARRHWAGLALVAAGVVVGFPLLTTLALQTSSTSHAAVVVGLLPLTTAAYSAWRHHARPPWPFWAAALTGAAVVVAFALRHGGGGLTTADGFLFAALLVCAAGYAEGGRLAREMPGWQVICWALAGCLPLAVPGALLALAVEPAHFGWTAAAGLAWLVVGSQTLGMAVWYRGMATIGVARASQLQLAQPLLTLGWAVLLLGEAPGALAPMTAVAVLGCIVVTQRSAARGSARPSGDARPVGGVRGPS
ncbi:DMT family transporter [Streptomyces sp. WMMC1477]|uniref:DMT family transporter n=1 Tax=Streptomyces sp. WMMC1477 TaxID=3015155 RepID=UPI0022B62C41|nr:DMT family transporter [Streptomyces sp. WMMC1477]MCZ7430361.1 DMT family transporter [Streptomyces sp. WMMC1477]